MTLNLISDNSIVMAKTEPKSESRIHVAVEGKVRRSCEKAQENHVECAANYERLSFTIKYIIHLPSSLSLSSTLLPGTGNWELGAGCVFINARLLNRVLIHIHPCISFSDFHVEFPLLKFQFCLFCSFSFYCQPHARHHHFCSQSSLFHSCNYKTDFVCHFSLCSLHHVNQSLRLILQCPLYYTQPLLFSLL